MDYNTIVVGATVTIALGRKSGPVPGVLPTGVRVIVKRRSARFGGFLLLWDMNMLSFSPPTLGIIADRKIIFPTAARRVDPRFHEDPE